MRQSAALFHPFQHDAAWLRMVCAAAMIRMWA
jgi:hypothetical protein